MKNIKMAIEQGKINEYLENLLLKDDDLPVLNKYIKLLEKPATLKQKYKNIVDLMVKDVTSKLPSGISSTPGFVLVNAIAKNCKHNDLITDELVKRYLNGKTDSKTLLSAVKKNPSIKLLKNLPEEIQSAYKHSQNFDNIDNLKDFDKFYELQSAGIYDVSLTSLDNLNKSLVLWDTRKEQIKDAFSYLDIWMIRNLSQELENENNTHYNEKIECIKHYIDKHINEKIIPMEGNVDNNDYVYINRNTESLKSICTKLKINDSLDKLNMHTNKEEVKDNKTVKMKV